MRSSYRSQYQKAIKEREALVSWSEEAKDVVSEEARLEIEAEMELKRALKGGKGKKRLGKAQTSTYEDHKPAKQVALPTRNDEERLGEVCSRRRFEQTSQYVKQVEPVEVANPTEDEINALVNVLRPRLGIDDQASVHEDNVKKHKLRWA